MEIAFALGLLVGGLCILNQRMRLEDFNGRGMVSANRNTRTTGEGK